MFSDQFCILCQGYILVWKIPGTLIMHSYNCSSTQCSRADIRGHFMHLLSSDIKREFLCIAHYKIIWIFMPKKAVSLAKILLKSTFLTPLSRCKIAYFSPRSMNDSKLFLLLSKLVGYQRESLLLVSLQNESLQNKLLCKFLQTWISEEWIPLNPSVLESFQFWIPSGVNSLILEAWFPFEVVYLQAWIPSEYIPFRHESLQAWTP